MHFHKQKLYNNRLGNISLPMPNEYTFPVKRKASIFNGMQPCMTFAGYDKFIQKVMGRPISVRVSKFSWNMFVDSGVETRHNCWQIR